MAYLRQICELILLSYVWGFWGDVLFHTDEDISQTERVSSQYLYEDHDYGDDLFLDTHPVPLLLIWCGYGEFL